MIRAVFRDGAVQPIDAFPAEWQEGEELIIEATAIEPLPESFEEWSAEIKAATAGVSDDDHDRLMAALAEVEAESKELGRREMERSHGLFADDPGATRSKEAGG